MENVFFDHSFPFSARWHATQSPASGIVVLSGQKANAEAALISPLTSAYA